MAKPRSVADLIRAMDEPCRYCDAGVHDRLYPHEWMEHLGMTRWEGLKFGCAFLVNWVPRELRDLDRSDIQGRVNDGGKA